MKESELLLREIQEALFSESTVAKIWGVASSTLDSSSPPTKTPEYSDGRYHFRDIDHWTAGFFSGSVAALIERQTKYPSKFPSAKIHPLKLEFASKWWAEGLVAQAPRTDTHDLGFIIEPTFRREFEQSKSEKALNCLRTAAKSLASRFDERVGVIRSWDTTENKRHAFEDKNKDFLVIIDNMCNLNMLYYVASITGDLSLSTIATTHADNTLKNHFREAEWSSYHVVNYDVHTGLPRAKFTHQGYSDESTWARGQAWAILGFAETYLWTKQSKFLQAAISIAEVFSSKLPADGVPPWDFDAPDKDRKDASAAMISALGFIKIFEATKNEQFLTNGLKLVRDTISLSLTNQSKIDSHGDVTFGEYDTILKDSTINNNPDTYERLVDHGLVYADYYFLTIGNKLLELGLYI
ncbi:Six-hairpin glycosidase [Scheffersomyces xylosifermentans]|uniref:Six-hairpin glycosidase n=1 Tax=Scheffersomyces xylosifermentans TaxID=1304137 RepID=UPI00315D3C18